MIIAIIYTFILLGGFGSLMYFTGMYVHWYWYWIPLIGFPLGYVLLYGITLALLFPIAKSINIDKEVKKPSKIAAFFVRQIDFLTIQNRKITPLEVKSGDDITLKSLKKFKDTFKNNKVFLNTKLFKFF